MLRSVSCSAFASFSLRRAAGRARTLARDRHSHPVSPTSERAVRFCLSGALIRAAGEEFGFAVKLVKASEPVTFEPSEPLVAAYRAAALAFFRVFVAGVEISELPGEPGKIGLAKTVWREEDGTPHELADVSWVALVEAANDMDEVSFPLIRMTLLVALALLAEAAGEPDAKGESGMITVRSVFVLWLLATAGFSAVCLCSGGSTRRAGRWRPG